MYVCVTTLQRCGGICAVQALVFNNYIKIYSEKYFHIKRSTSPITGRFRSVVKVKGARGLPRVVNEKVLFYA